MLALGMAIASLAVAAYAHGYMRGRRAMARLYGPRLRAYYRTIHGADMPRALWPAGMPESEPQAPPLKPPR